MNPILPPTPFFGGPAFSLYGWLYPFPDDYTTPGGATTSGANLLSMQWQAPVSSPVADGGNWLPGTWTSLSYYHTGNHACGAGIKSDGSLWTWGNQNNNRELGQSITTNNYLNATPKKVGSSSWAMVSNGGNNMHAIDSVGRLFAWGENGSGQLGDGTTVAKSSPVQIGSSSWSFVASGDVHCAAIRAVDGALFTWGNNGGGQLGDGTITAKSSPVKIGSSSWSMVDASSANQGYTFALRIDGGFFSWGDNAGGQLGSNSTTSRSSPVQVGTSSWSFLSCGGKNGAGIRTDGGLFTWGDNSAGQLGDGTTTNKSSPVKIGSSSWAMVSIGGFDGNPSNCHAIDSVGRLFGWGSNGQGQIGDGTTTNRSSPVQVGSDSWSWVQTAHGVNNWGTGTSGGGNVLAIKSDGTVWRWGGLNPDAAPAYDPFLGDGDGGRLSWAMPGAKKVVMSSGGSVLCIDGGNKLWAWGLNSAGQLGDGTTTNKSSPVQIGALNWKDIYLGGLGEKAYALGITTDGALYAWGNNSNGQLGDGTTTAKSSPVQIGTSSWSFVCSGGAGEVSGADTGPTSAAIRIDGALFTWGLNNNGSMGDGTAVAKSSPVKIGSSSWAMVSMGGGSNGGAGIGYYTLAIDAVGRLFGWGQNAFGQLGDGTSTARSSPVVIGSSSWSFVSAGVRSSAGIRIDGGLFTWGNNTSGVLGDGTTTTRSSPVKIGTSSWSLVYSGRLGMLGKTTANQLFWWGASFTPNLAPASSSSPVAIGSAQNWRQIQGTHGTQGKGTVIGIR